MTAIQVATSVIEKLQEENRFSLETLHKAQDSIRFLEHQLSEKDKLIKVLEDRIRTGTNSFLEMSNRQKELTIKNLELQIKKLLRENEDLEYQINAVKSDICAKCETKLLLGSETDKKTRSVKKPVPKSVSCVSDKKEVQHFCPDRQKMLERIIDHKDKRITHLSKEVCRLTQTEKELTDKVYRLTKLLPMSHMSSEMLTECLLKEIQLLESQIHSYKDKCDHLPFSEELKRFKGYDDFFLVKGIASALKPRYQKNDFVPKKSFEKIQTDNTKAFTSDVQVKDSDTLLTKLHKLYSDVYGVKQLLAFENERFHEGLNKDSSRKEMLKIQWDEVVSRLNDVAKIIHEITQSSSKSEIDHANESNALMEKDNVIMRLQERLRESLEIVSEYESDIKTLKENVESLKSELVQEKEKHAADVFELKQIIQEQNVPYSVQKIRTHGNLDDIDKLKELLDSKQAQLDAAEGHIRTCQRFIEELQKVHHYSENPTNKLQSTPSQVDVEKLVLDPGGDAQCKLLQTQLDVAERNIKSCEDVIEQLQNSVHNLEQENEKLEAELRVAKSEKLLSEASDHQNKNLKTKLTSSESQVTSLQSMVTDLQNKILMLESKNVKLQNTSQVKMLQEKLDFSEKQIKTLEKNLESLQDKLKNAENKKEMVQNDLRDKQNFNIFSKSYEDDILSMKNQMILLEEENKKLKDSLHALENKALEMNHYRKALYREIEELCKTLSDSGNGDEEESFNRRKAIYKAAVLRSAQALLKFDEDYKLKIGEGDQSSALEEMKHQVSVYLAEVSRIHELITIQEKEREVLLKEYLDIDGLSEIYNFTKDRYIFEGEGSGEKLKSSPVTKQSTSGESSVNSSNDRAIVSKEKTGCKRAKNVQFKTTKASENIEALQEELSEAKSVTSYLLTSCSRLEESLATERTEHAKCARELEINRESIKEIKLQLNTKNTIMKRLNTLIEMMRSRECNDEITMEQLKSEIKWLVEENQKIFERVTTTQSELSRCKEENSRIQNDIDTLKRQLLNEKYDHAKVNNELKRLRLQLSHSQSLDDT